MRNAFLCLIAAAALSGCGGTLRVRYDLLDSNYVRTAMLEQRIPEQIRIVRGICGGQKCVGDPETAVAKDLIGQANAATKNHWDDIEIFCKQVRATCTRPEKLDPGILGPHAIALQQVSARLNEVLAEKAKPFDSNNPSDVPLDVHEFAVARASATDGLGVATKLAVADYKNRSTDRAREAMEAVKAALERRASPAKTESERSAVLRSMAKTAGSVHVFTRDAGASQAIVRNANEEVADETRTDQKVKNKPQVSSESSEQQRANDALLKSLSDFLSGFAKETPRELTTNPGALSGYRLDRAKEAFVVAHAPDDYWSEKYQKAYGKGYLGNVNVAVRYTPADLAAEGSLGSFNIKGLTFDPSQVAQMASKAVTQGLLMYTQMATGRLPSVSTTDKAATPTSASSSGLVAEVDGARKMLALYDAQMRDRRDALQELHELILALIPNGTSTDNAKRKEAAQSLDRWLTANKARLAPNLSATTLDPAGGTEGTATHLGGLELVNSQVGATR